MLENTAIAPVPVKDTEFDTEATHATTCSLVDFVRDFKAGLLDAVRQQNPPRYQEYQNLKRDVVLAQLKRQPFPAQQKVIHAITHLLINEGENAGIINAEMGTGKTMMGIATAALMHAEGYHRTLVLSPPHLVYKWRREILETVPNAKVVVLNGADALSQLISLSHRLDQGEKIQAENPEFFIIGRVRLRMGYHWQPAFMQRRWHKRLSCNDYDESAATFVKTEVYAACPRCGEWIMDAEGSPIHADRFSTDKCRFCESCGEALWTLIRQRSFQNTREQLIKLLCRLPTIGSKRAEQLVRDIGEDSLMAMLGDNFYQLVNRLDAEGNPIFTDRQAQRMERVMAKMEFVLGQGGYPVTEYIKRYLPKHFFSLLLVDEAHEYKSLGSAQGQAMGVLASQVKKVILLTGTLMGGYAEDLFYLLWRILPSRIKDEGFCPNKRGSLSSAAMRFMEQHGVLKRVYRSQEGDNHKTARGKRQQVNISKAPGFGPQGISRFVLPYTAFLKLPELGQTVLPPYQEHLIEVEMADIQAETYRQLEATLLAALKAALKKGDRTLLGVVLNSLLAWPDCCFREEIVKHPRTGNLLAFVAAKLDEETSPKEQAMLNLCSEAKRKGQRVLVYTTYTGTRDTSTRLQQLLTQAGFKSVVLRASVSTDQREDWIAEQIDREIDVLICNPELVKTGLDLLEFPTLIFMQSGFSVYTLMQASRRSWRIGQQQAVNVYFLGYTGTAQIKCLELMAKKIAVTQSTAGTMPETGLDILNHESDSVEVALAKQLIK